MLAKPCISHRPCPTIRTVHRTRHTPQIRIMMQHPATTTIHSTGSFTPILAQFTYHLDEWFMKFGQVGDFRRPVIHLSLNVGRIIRSPRRLNVPVPDALQIGGQPARAGRGNQQVTTVLIVEFRQSVVSGVLFEAF